MKARLWMGPRSENGARTIEVEWKGDYTLDFHADVNRLIDAWQAVEESRARVAEAKLALAQAQRRAKA